MKSIAAGCAIIFLFAGRNVAAGSPTFQPKITKRVGSKPTDSIVVLNERKRTGFLISDSFGIGSATISLTAGRWPQSIILRFRYQKGRGFKTLEGFRMTTARMLIQGEMQTSGKMRFYLPDADGKFDTNQSPAGEINVVVEQRNGGVEVLLPRNLLVGSKTFEIGWVDAYR